MHVDINYEALQNLTPRKYFDERDLYVVLGGDELETEHYFNNLFWALKNSPFGPMLFIKPGYILVAIDDRYRSQVDHSDLRERIKDILNQPIPKEYIAHHKIKQYGMTINSFLATIIWAFHGIITDSSQFNSSRYTIGLNHNDAKSASYTINNNYNTNGRNYFIFAIGDPE